MIPKFYSPKDKIKFDNHELTAHNNTQVGFIKHTYDDVMVSWLRPSNEEFVETSRIIKTEGE